MREIRNPRWISLVCQYSQCYQFSPIPPRHPLLSNWEAGANIGREKLWYCGEREDIRDQGKYLMTREQKIKSPINDRNMIQGKMSYLQEINKDDQLDNWIIFGTVETFLFFPFPISSVAPWLTAAFLHSLSVLIWPALAPIRGGHLARPPRSGGQIVSRRIHIINRD